MNAASTWQRRTAAALVRHAARMLRTARPAWAEAIESELEHVPGRYRPLIWALGCVRASYCERYEGRTWSALAATAVGLAFAVSAEQLSGVLAAVAWPHWYTAFARTHRHLGLELWWIIEGAMPVSFLAVGFGALLARLARTSSLALPCVSIAAWLFYAMLPVPSSCVVLMRSLWAIVLLFPAAYTAALILPAAGLLFGFCRFRTAQLREASSAP